MRETRRIIKITQDDDFLYFINMQADTLQISKDFGSDMCSVYHDDAKEIATFICEALEVEEDIEVNSLLRDLEKL